MPELPDLLHVVSRLRERLTGREVVSERVHEPVVLRFTVRGNLSLLLGRGLHDVFRKSHFVVFRFGWSSYIVPFLFVYSPAILMQGSIVDIVTVTITSIFGIWLICAAMVGYFVKVMDWRMRVAFALSGIMLLSPHQVSDLLLWINILGVIGGIALMAYELKARRAYVRA